MSPPGKAGPSAVFAEVVRQTPLIHRVVRKRGIPAEHRDDLCQEVLTVAWQWLQDHAFRVPRGKTLTEAVRGWVTSIASVRSLNFRRKLELRDRKFVHDDAAIENAAADGMGPEERVSHAEVLAALDRLSPPQRRLLVMVGAGFDDDEIARELGCEVEAVSGRIQRARAAFRDALARWRRVHHR